MVMSERLTPASGFGLDTRDAMATESVSRMMLRSHPDHGKSAPAPAPSSLAPPSRLEERGAPIVDGLVEGEDDEVEVLEDGALLDLVSEEEADGVVEGVEDGLEHELVLALWADDIEGEVDRRAVEN